MFTLWLKCFNFFSFSSFPISTRCSSLPLVGPHTLHFFPLQASIPPLAADLSLCPTSIAPTTPIDLFILRPYLSAISLSSTLSLNISSSQTPRPMIAGVGFWFCCRDWQNSVVAVTGFYVDGFYFYFDEWVLILLMDDEWGLLMVDEWWLGFSCWWMVVVVVVVGVTDGRGGCGWCCGCFLGRGYIILLCWKLK